MAKNAELSEFLRTRRARMQPTDVGIEATGQRRVPGLRREEVAMLAGVSLDYYARMERGRDLQPSDQVLDAIARALRLADVEREHLHNLVRSTMPARQPGDLQPRSDEDTHQTSDHEALGKRHSVQLPSLRRPSVGGLMALQTATRA